MNAKAVCGCHWCLYFANVRERTSWVYSPVPERGELTARQILERNAREVYGEPKPFNPPPFPVFVD